MASPVARPRFLRGVSYALPFSSQGLRRSLARPRIPFVSSPTALEPRFVSRRLFSQQSQQRPRFSSRLRTALRNSKIQWYQIPVGLGIGFLGLVQFYKVSTREARKQEAESQDEAGGSRPGARARVRPDGPW